MGGRTEEEEEERRREEVDEEIEERVQEGLYSEWGAKELRREASTVKGEGDNREKKELEGK